MDNSFYKYVQCMYNVSIRNNKTNMYAKCSDFHREQQLLKEVQKDSPFEIALLVVSMTVAFIAFIWAMGFIEVLIKGI